MAKMSRSTAHCRRASAEATSAYPAEPSLSSLIAIAEACITDLCSSISR
jgi:hypothetical protein